MYTARKTLLKDVKDSVIAEYIAETKVKDSDRIYFVTGPQVGACECTMEFECVMGNGTMEYVSEEEKIAALQTMLRQYDVKEGQNYHFHQEVVPRIHVLRLRVNFLSAKKREVSTRK